MDQFYFEEGYLVAGYVTVVKEVSAGLTPYFVDGYLPVDYFVYEGNAINGQYSLSALLTKIGDNVFAVGSWSSSTATLITANVIASGASTITATFTQTSTISHIEGADLFAFSNAQLEAAVHRLRDNNITASAAFSIAVDVIRTRNTSSEDAAIFSFTATTVRSRDYESVQSAAFSLAAVIDNRTRDQSSALTSQFIVTATISHIEGADLTAFSNAELTATATRIKQIASTQSVSTTVVADVTRNPGIILNLSSQFAQTAQGRIASKGGAANLSSSFVIYTSLKLGSRRPFNLYGDSRFVTVSSAFAKAGTKSLRINQLGDRFAISATNVFDFPQPQGRSEFGIQANENFVFETWIYIKNNTGPAFSRESVIAGVSLGAGNTATSIITPDMRNYSAGQSCWAFGVNFNGYLKAYYSNQSTGTASNLAATTNSLPTNAWSHIAFRRISGNTLQLLLNGNVVGSTTYSGSLLPSGSGQDVETNKRFFLANTFNGTLSEEIYFDETSYRVGLSSIAGYSSQPIIGDPASQQLLFHYESDQSYNTDYTVIADDTGFVTQFSGQLDLVSGLRCNSGLRLLGAASVSTSATITATVDRVRFIEFSASLSSAVSTATTGQRVRISAVSLDSEFTQSADVRVIKGLTSNQSSIFTSNAEAVKTVNIVSGLDSQATFTGTISHIEGADLVAFSNVSLAAIGQVTRQLASTQSSAFTSTADNLRVRFAASDISSQFAQSATVVKTAGGVAAIALEATTSTQAIRVRFADSVLASAFSLSAAVQRLKIISAALSSEFSTSRPYILGDYLETGYYEVLEISAIKTANAVINTEAIAIELAAVAKVAQFFVNADVVSTLTADLIATRELSADLSSSIDLTANNDTIRGFGVILQANTFQSAGVGLIKETSSSQASQFTVAAAAIKTGSNAVIVSSEFALSATVRQLNGFDSALSSEFAVEATANIISNLSSTQSSESSVSAIVNSAFVASAGLTSAASLTASISHIESINIVVSGFATLTADGLAGKFAESDQSAVFTQTAAALRFRGISSAISSNFNVVAAVNEVVQLSSTIDSQATLSAAVNKTVRVSSSQTAVVSVSCVISHIEGADIVANGFAALAADVDRIAGIAVTATSAFNFTASADKFRAFNANLAVSTTVVVNGVKVNRGQATLQAQATIVANATRIKQFNIAITSAMTFVAAIREIDAASLNQFVYTIAREDYVYIVPDEIPVYNDILYVIPNENWTYNITAETRVFPVDQETRIYNIRSS